MVVFTRLFASMIAIAMGAGSGMAQQQPDKFISSRDEMSSSPQMMTGFDHILWGQGNPRDRVPGLWASFRAAPDPSFACKPPGKTARLCDNMAEARCISAATAEVPYPPENVRARTGLLTDQVFMPKCPTSDARGESFVALSQDKDAGGIGLYLRSGTGEDGKQAFLQVSSHTKFADVQGIYFNFRSAYVAPKDRMRPFFGAGDCHDTACQDSYKLQIGTEQTYAGFQDNGYSGAVQIFRFLLRNSNGTPGLRDDGVLNIGMRTFCNHSSVSKRDSDCPNRVSMDPKQGEDGQNYYSGQFGPSGTETTVSIPLGGGKKPYVARLWTSQGQPTGDTAFANSQFGATISWAQFVSMLRGVAYKKGYDGATDAGVAKVFGDGWSNPNNWFVQSVRFGQELKNPNWNGAQSADNRGAGSGGSMEWFSLKALKP
ncbi:hypothetical protein LA6_005220 [Marinibacterium anthonyi]|nr:hypothetical protein LA6_005220 [Marinibacterium anthonyi]